MAAADKPANPWWWVKPPDPWIIPFWLGYALVKPILLVLLGIGVYGIITKPAVKHPVPTFGPPPVTEEEMKRRGYPPK